MHGVKYQPRCDHSDASCEKYRYPSDRAEKFSISPSYDDDGVAEDGER